MAETSGCRTGGCIKRYRQAICDTTESACYLGNQKKRYPFVADAASLLTDGALYTFDAYAAPISLGGWRVDGGIPHAAGVAVGFSDVVADTVCAMGIRTYG